MLFWNVGWSINQNEQRGNEVRLIAVGLEARLQICAVLLLRVSNDDRDLARVIRHANGGSLATQVGRGRA
jgi:hypothetical protein